MSSWLTTSAWKRAASNTERFPRSCLWGLSCSFWIHQLGISQRRAEWFIKWTQEMAGATRVNMTHCEEGVERIMCVAGALEY